MKNLKKRLSKLLCLVTAMGCFMGAQPANVMAYTVPGVQDINEDVFKFDEDLYPSESYTVFVTPYVYGSTGSLYIRFTNWNRADLEVSLTDVDARRTVYRENTTEKNIAVTIDDLDPDHEYRIRIINYSDFTTNIYGSIL